MNSRDRLYRRLAVREAIRGCTSCDLVKHAKPVPFAGPNPAKFIVLGEAPGRSEDHHGQPFIGPSGRLLRRMLAKAGLDEYDAAFMNVVSCNPWGSPPQASIDACRHHLLEQLAVADSPFVLAAGATALQAMIPDGQLRRLHGHPYLVETETPHDTLKHKVFPIFHPAYLLRDNSDMPVVQGELGNFRELIKDVLPIEWLRNGKCSQCGEAADEWDERMVPYCNKHKGQIQRRIKAEKRRRKGERKAAQGRFAL